VIELPGARSSDVGTIALLAAPDWKQRRSGSGAMGLGAKFRNGRIVVTKVKSGGPAARSGLAAGEIVPGGVRFSTGICANTIWCGVRSATAREWTSLGLRCLWTLPD
jgi:hypothetical protein